MPGTCAASVGVERNVMLIADIPAQRAAAQPIQISIMGCSLGSCSGQDLQLVCIIMMEHARHNVCGCQIHLVIGSCITFQAAIQLSISKLCSCGPSNNLEGPCPSKEDPAFNQSFEAKVPDLEQNAFLCLSIHLVAAKHISHQLATAPPCPVHPLLVVARTACSHQASIS